MRWKLPGTSLTMHFRMLMRQKIVLLLLAGIPTLFIFIVCLTASEREVFFRVGIAETKTMIKATEANVSLIFVSMATIGFYLPSFLLALFSNIKTLTGDW
jgi:carbon starvation protein CstA